MPLDRLVSVSEAAKLLGGISKWTVHAWLSQGRLQRVKIGSRTMLKESDLRKVIQEGEGGKSPAPPRPEEACDAGGSEAHAKRRGRRDSALS